ncbi:MAG TPA: universal stress protein [Candidatus Obscuribacterales bacterium]
MAKRIAVGLDGSEPSWKALREAAWLARHYGAELVVVSIQESIEAAYSASEVLAAEKTARDTLERIQAEAELVAEKEGVQVSTTILTGNPTTSLKEYVAKSGVDLLVIGDKGHSSIWGALLGTTAEKIVRVAPCSVLVVR